MRLIHEYLLESAYHHPEKSAVLCDGRDISYSELIEKIETQGEVLASLGIRRGDRVLILLQNKADFLVACYAAIKLGAIVVPLTESVVPVTIEQIVGDCSPAVIITTEKDLSGQPVLHNKLGCRLLLMGARNSHRSHYSFSDAVFFDTYSHSVGKRSSIVQNLREDDGALIFYTSGTTGKAEGILLSHRNLIKTALNTNAFTGIDASIRELVTVPMEQSFGFARSQCVFTVGGSIVVNSGMLNPVALVQSVLKHQCDAVSSSPSGFAMFFGRLEPLLQRISRQIRLIELGSCSMPLDHKMNLLSMFPNARIYMHYGLTEACSSTSIEFRKEQRKLHTVGRPTPNVAVVIRDDSGNNLDQMQLGEILLQGDHVALGYWKNEESNTERFTTDGWFKTGEYGFLDEEGYLHLLGRKDEMIKMGDSKVSPAEIEERIREVYPDCEIWIVGVPDPEGFVGEIPVLCYSARNGRALTPSGLSQALLGRLDQTKIPRIVYRIEHLPKTENARTLRRELRQRIIGGIAHEVEQVQ
jgi:acyl-CoA synthetase (AMP-forming)/AMP-acid ligase II